MDGVSDEDADASVSIWMNETDGTWMDTRKINMYTAGSGADAPMGGPEGA